MHLGHGVGRRTPASIVIYFNPLQVTVYYVVLYKQYTLFINIGKFSLLKFDYIKFLGHNLKVSPLHHVCVGI
jgi:hypothetical protein